MNQASPTVWEQLRPITSPAVFWVASCLVVALLATMVLTHSLVAEFDRLQAAELQRKIATIWVSWVTVVGFGVGVRSVAERHPATRSDYQSWLEGTPWQAGMPLLLGPVRLHAREAWIATLCVILATPMLLWAGMLPIHAALAPVAAILAGAAWPLLGAVNKGDGGRFVAATVVAVLGLSHLVSIERLLFLGPAAAYLIGLVAARRTLSTFPWPAPDAATPDLGWPYGVFHRRIDEVRVPTGRAAFWSIFVALAVFDVLWRLPIDSEGAGILTMFSGMFCFLFAVMFVTAYGPAICPRLCWGRRVGGRQWINPRHDSIFAIALAMALSGALLPWLLTSFCGVPIAFSVAIGVGLAVFLMCGVGPRVEDLALTGPHAIQPRISQQHRRSERFVQVSG